MPTTLVMSPVTTKIPNMPQAASAIAIGTPSNRQTTSATSGRTILGKYRRVRSKFRVRWTDHPDRGQTEWLDRLNGSRGLGRALLREQQGLARPNAAEIEQHQQQQCEKAERHQRLRWADPDRQGRERGAVAERL